MQIADLLGMNPRPSTRAPVKHPSGELGEKSERKERDFGEIRLSEKFVGTAKQETRANVVAGVRAGQSPST